MWGTLPDEKTDLFRLQLLLALASIIIPGSESRGTHDYILLSQIQYSHNLEILVPVFISPKKRVAQLYPQALGSLFDASYDSQSYGGGIRTRLYAGNLPLTLANTVHLYFI
jgi:lipopolysaccharide assembly outer membrane protein LptD (OstA)